MPASQPRKLKDPIRRVKVWGGAVELRSECMLVVNSFKSVKALKQRAAKVLKIEFYIEKMMAAEKMRQYPDYIKDFQLYHMRKKSMQVDPDKQVKKLSDLEFGDTIVLTWDKLLLDIEAWRCEECRHLNTCDAVDCISCGRGNPALRYKTQAPVLEEQPEPECLVYRWRCKGCFNPNEGPEEMTECPTCHRPRPADVVAFSKTALKKMDKAKRRKKSMYRPND